MPAIWLELHTDCPRCLGPVPVHLVANALPCPRCGTKVTLAPDVALSQVVLGREGQVGMFGSAGGIGGRFGPAEGLACARCEALVDPLTAAPDGALRCGRCAAPMSLRAVPEEWRTKVPEGITHFVGEAHGAMMAQDGQTPLVQRFYLWGDPDADARAEAERQRALRSGALLWLALGLLLLGGGAAFFLWRGTELWAAMAAPAAGGGTWAAFLLPLLAVVLGALFTGLGADRLSRAAAVLLGIAGFLLCMGCGFWLYFKGQAPWAIVGATAGGSFFVYLIRELIPSF